MPRLRVKSGRHFKGGKKFAPGEEFDGTLAELNAFSDKLELVEEAEPVDDSELKVSIPSGQNKRGRPKKRPDDESDRSTDSVVD